MRAPKQRVLVTDGDERSALAIVRSLGRAGYEVYVCSRTGRSLAGGSRHCRGEASTGDPLSAPEAFLAGVTALVRQWGIEVLIPVAEASLLSLLPARDAMPGVCIPFPPLATFRRICDKTAVLAAAPAVGIAVPEQHLIASRRDRRKLSPGSVRYPVVLKPARSIGERGRRRTKLGVLHAANWQELSAHLGRLDESAYPLMIQQRIVGPGIGIFLLRWNGELLAVFSHRRIREKPPSGGVSVYRESIPADPDLVARSSALLAEFGWEGVAMIEYKVEEETGTPYLMEINGRFWGSLQLAVDAGVDFPKLLLRAAAGEDPLPVLDYRLRVRSRWWWGDVDHLLARLRHSPARLALPPGAPGRWRAVRDFLTLWRPGDRNEILRLTDPTPFLRETAQWFRNLRTAPARSGSSTSTATTRTTGGTPSRTSASSRPRVRSRSSG